MKFPWLCRREAARGLPEEAFLKSKHFPFSESPPSEKVSFPGEAPNRPATLRPWILYRATVGKKIQGDSFKKEQNNLSADA